MKNWKVWTVWNDWRARRSTRLALMALDDHLLQDIGLERGRLSEFVDELLRSAPSSPPARVIAFQGPASSASASASSSVSSSQTKDDGYSKAA